MPDHLGSFFISQIYPYFCPKWRQDSFFILTWVIFEHLCSLLDSFVSIFLGVSGSFWPISILLPAYVRMERKLIYLLLLELQILHLYFLLNASSFRGIFKQSSVHFASHSIFILALISIAICIDCIEFMLVAIKQPRLFFGRVFPKHNQFAPLYLSFQLLRLQSSLERT